LREGAAYLHALGQGAAGIQQRLPQDPWRLLAARKMEVSELLTKTVERNLLRHSIERIQGVARLRPERRVEVTKADGSRITLRAAVVLLATGSRPRHPDGFPMDDPDVHDSESILGIANAPASLVVLGGGAAGCEYASVFATLGVRVTLVDRHEQLLRALDAEAAGVLAECFNAIGIRVLTGVDAARVERRDDVLVATLSDGREIAAEKVLVTAGRRASVSSLGLEEAGVAVDARGFVKVDERYATTAPGVYAAGDVLGPPGLASQAMEQGRVAISHAFDLENKTPMDPFCPNYIFSIPEVACVGLSEQGARAQGIEYEVGRASFATNAKARISGWPEGFVKLVFRLSDRRLLGAHIVGEVASELVHIPKLVMHDQGRLDRFIDLVFAVPTRSEAFKYAAYDGLNRAANRTARAATQA
jgi:NAD(P) transhydrogenase